MKDEKKLVEDEQVSTYKSLRKAPCVFRSPDPRTKRKHDYYPSVNCEFHCDHCGWNPAVAKKRVAKMLAELEALQRRAYPEFYHSLHRTEPEQTTPAQPETIQSKQEQPAATTTEPQEIETEPRKLNAIQIAQGLYYYFARPIRRARMRCKARK